MEGRRGEGRGGILTIVMFGSWVDGRDFKTNLSFYPYKHQRISQFWSYSV
jgi:hypothetical protein